MANAVEDWWDDFLLVWGMFNPECRARWKSQQREELDADLIVSCGGNFDGAGTGGQD